MALNNPVSSAILESSSVVLSFLNVLFQGLTDKLTTDEMVEKSLSIKETLRGHRLYGPYDCYRSIYISFRYENSFGR